MSSRPQKATGTKNKAAPSYLSDSFITDDGVEVPPPTRPMGPRRLSRYYDEAADYLRAVARGDKDLPPVPMFMGKVEGLDLKTDPGQALAGLSQMGNISTAEEELDLDFDENQVTVVQDPLGHIGQQILGEPQDERLAGPDQIDFAAAPVEFGGDSDFISVEELSEGTEDVASETDLAPAPVEVPGGAEPEDETAGEVSSDPEPAEKESGEASGQVETVVEASAPVAAAPVAESPIPLPAPVKAVDAQGLDLTELDSQNPPAHDRVALASDAASAVESDSSEENNQVPEGYIVAGSEEDTVSEPVSDLPQESEASASQEDEQDVTGSTGQTDQQAHSASDREEASGLAQASSSDEPRKGGAIIATVGLFLFLIAVVLVWVVFYS